MEEMDRILTMGYNLSLSPWWFVHHVREKDFVTMRKRMDDKDEWLQRMRILWNWDNLCYINNVPRPQNIDLFELRRDLEMRRYARPKPKYYDTDAYRQAVAVYEIRIKKLLRSGKPIKTQQQYLREKLNQCQKTSY